MSEVRWYFAIGADRFGPLSPVELESMLDGHPHHSDGYLWRPGMQDWVRVGQIFPARERPPSSGTRFPLLPLILAIGATFGVGWVAWNDWNRFDADSAPIVVLGTALAGTVVHLWFLRRLWMHGQTLARSDQSGAKGGVWRSFACLGIPLALLLPCLIVSDPFGLLRIARAREAYDRTTVRFDPATSTVLIDGMIGPEFAKDLAGVFTGQPGIGRVEINSGGGLLDTALEGARLLERHRVTTIARGECSSACVALLMAGEKRLADWYLQIGLHAVSSITPDNWLEEAVSSMNEEYWAYLSKRGMPSAVVESAKDSSDLVFFRASRLARDGALTGLLDGQKPVSADTADLLLVEEMLASDPATEPVAGTFRATWESKPDYLTKDAPPLLVAVRKMDSFGDPDLMTPLLEEAARVAVRTLRRTAREAQAAADPQAVYDFYRAGHAQLRHLNDTQQWSLCADYVKGTVLDDGQLDSTTSIEEWAQAEKLVRSAASRQWARAAVPEWAESEAAKVQRETSQRVQGGLVSAAGKGADARSTCEWNVELGRRLLARSPERLAGALTYLPSADPSGSSRTTR